MPQDHCTNLLVGWEGYAVKSVQRVDSGPGGHLAQSYAIAQKNVKGVTLDATTIFRTYLLAK